MNLILRIKLSVVVDKLKIEKEANPPKRYFWKVECHISNLKNCFLIINWMLICDFEAYEKVNIEPNKGV